MTRRVVLLVYPGFVLLDFSGPLDALSLANEVSRLGYQLTVASLHGGLVRSSSGVEIATEALPKTPIDTLIVAGSLAPPEGPWVGELATAIRETSGGARAVRRASERVRSSWPKAAY